MRASMVGERHNVRGLEEEIRKTSVEDPPKFGEAGRAQVLAEVNVDRGDDAVNLRRHLQQRPPPRS
jgi:hypothetical protein